MLKNLCEITEEEIKKSTEQAIKTSFIDLQELGNNASDELYKIAYGEKSLTDMLSKLDMNDDIDS